jgi:site-specific recombinase XerD
MSVGQLPLFQRKTYKGIISSIPLEARVPAADMAILAALPGYYLYLKDGGFSQYTPDDFTGDVKKFAVFLNEKPIKDITTKDIQAWISFLKTPSPKGEGLSAKTVSRKLSALSNFFNWLLLHEVIDGKTNPMANIVNSRITPPLPEILFEDECTRLLAAASNDPRTYLLFLLFLETGIKLEELFDLKISHFDFSNKYSPEMLVKHTAKKAKRDRTLKLPMEIGVVFNEYVERYEVGDSLFPYSQRFIRYLITETAEKAGIQKQVSAQILRDTCAVRQLKRGEGIERVLQRLGLSETTWEDARVKYTKLAKGGI